MEDKPKFTIQEIKEEARQNPDRDSGRGIFQSLVKIQSEISGVNKKGSNPMFRSKFMTLEDIQNTLKPILEKHGCGYVFNYCLSDHRLIFFDSKGDSFAINIPPIDYNQSVELNAKGKRMRSLVQEQGANDTYQKRRLLCSMFALTPEEDNDGNPPSSKPRHEQVDVDQINPLDYRIQVLSKHKGKLLTECHRTELIGELNYWGEKAKTEKLGVKLLTDLKVIRKYINSIKEEEIGSDNN